MRVGIDIRVADPVGPGQQRYLWRLGRWLAAASCQVQYITVRPQAADMEPPGGTTLHRFSGRSRQQLRAAVSALELDVLLINPERSRRYRGIGANVLRSAYGTEHYRQKLRSFRDPIERALRRSLRAAPWVLCERRWERAFYEATSPAPQVIAQSEYMRSEILTSYDLPEQNVHVVHNAVDTAEFSSAASSELRATMRDRWAIPSDAFCLLFVGHNFRLKGLWQVLRVIPKLGSCARDVYLLVVGRGTGSAQRRKARRIVVQQGLTDRVVIAGTVRSAIEPLAAADALLHLSWHDSFGFVALEAMACGIPVVTTRYTGASELVEDGVNGLLVEPGSDREVIGAIRALDDPTARERIGAAAAKTASQHDEERNFREVLPILQSARERSIGPIR